jgi:hypothetical protein
VSTCASFASRSYCYMCVLILLQQYLRAPAQASPRASHAPSSLCLPLPSALLWCQYLYFCISKASEQASHAPSSLCLPLPSAQHIYPHTTTTYVSSKYYMCVLILLHMCPHTTTYVSAYCYICVLILLHVSSYYYIYIPAYCYICVLILLHMCPHTAPYVSSY